MMTKREYLKTLHSHAEGVRARIEDKPIEDNPYEKGTDDYLAWNAGWARSDYLLKGIVKNDGDKATAE
jgi:hypothetical protein